MFCRMVVWQLKSNVMSDIMLNCEFRQTHLFIQSKIWLHLPHKDMKSCFCTTIFFLTPNRSSFNVLTPDACWRRLFVHPFYRFPFVVKCQSRDLNSVTFKSLWVVFESSNLDKSRGGVELNQTNFELILIEFFKYFFTFRMNQNVNFQIELNEFRMNPDSENLTPYSWSQMDRIEFGSIFHWIFKRS